MIFNDERIISRGLKATNWNDWSPNGVKHVINNIFIGLFNQEEILKALSKSYEMGLESVFVECGLSYWLYTDLDGEVHINNELFSILEMHVQDPFKCVEIDPMYRSGMLYHNDVKDGLKSVTNKFTDLIKEVNNQ